MIPRAKDPSSSCPPRRGAADGKRAIVGSAMPERAIRISPRGSARKHSCHAMSLRATERALVQARKRTIRPFGLPADSDVLSKSCAARARTPPRCMPNFGRRSLLMRGGFAADPRFGGEHLGAVIGNPSRSSRVHGNAKPFPSPFDGGRVRWYLDPIPGAGYLRASALK